MLFSIQVVALRTTTVGELENVVKQVDWNGTGEQEGQTFTLPQTTELGDPDPESFIPYGDLTEAAVVGWVELAAENLSAVQAHTQAVLDQSCARASLICTQLPWEETE